MPKHKRKHEEQPIAQSQPYDTILKSLFEGQEQQIISYFLAGAEYVETLDIEVLRTTLRVDRVYRIWRGGILYVLDVEFQASGEKDDAARLLDYHSYFHRKYDCPVISIIVYPFSTSVAVSPHRELHGDEEALVFHFHVIKLWEWSADYYMRTHAVPLYALLPTMAGVNTEMLHKAIDEMVEYYQGSDVKLAREIRWLGVILRRAEIMPGADKQEIEERLNMFDDLMERDPKMRKIRAESEARGEARGEAKGLQTAVVTLVESRYPPLTDLARQKVRRIKTPESLNIVLKSLLAAPDETSVRLLLELLVA